MSPKTPPSSSFSDTNSQTDGGRLAQEIHRYSAGDAKDGTVADRPISKNKPPGGEAVTKFAGKTPGEIVTSALKNRRPVSGGLKKAINLYQENRRSSTSTAANSQKTSLGSGAEEGKGNISGESDRLCLVENDAIGRHSASESEFTYVRIGTDMSTCRHSL